MWIKTRYEETPGLAWGRTLRASGAEGQGLECPRPFSRDISGLFVSPESLSVKSLEPLGVVRESEESDHECQSSKKHNCNFSVCRGHLILRNGWRAFYINSVPNNFFRQLLITKRLKRVIRLSLIVFLLLGFFLWYRPGVHAGFVVRDAAGQGEPEDDNYQSHNNDTYANLGAHTTWWFRYLILKTFSHYPVPSERICAFIFWLNNIINKLYCQLIFVWNTIFIKGF